MALLILPSLFSTIDYAEIKSYFCGDGAEGAAGIQACVGPPVNVLC